MGLPSIPARRAPRSRGQSLVEFALVAPFFFFLLMATLNGGLYLYGKNALDHAADVGMATLAAEGDYSVPTDPAPNDADQAALQRMRNAGLGTSGMVTTSEVDVYRLVQQSDGTLVPDTTGCGGACRNRYHVDGSLIGSLVWPPSQRSVTDGTNDFVGLDIVYTFHPFAVPGAAWTVTSTKYFRLEPQR